MSEKELSKTRESERFKYFPDLKLAVRNRNLAPLTIVKRQEPKDAQDFFTLIKGKEIKTSILVHKRFAITQLDSHLRMILPKKCISSNFYKKWVEDMANICVLFSDITKTKEIIFWLSSTRVCKNFHIDKTDFRLLVTYSGAGTEWISTPMLHLENMENLSKDTIYRLKTWNIALFNSCKDGIVHRSPQVKENSWSLLMRLDSSNFKKMKKA
ncbi:MAG: DUF1826 domain-containing protein [Pseudomonadota bacterium]|nr:DUF1826 domain-containing protein [Pseudomonadota bacterium]